VLKAYEEARAWALANPAELRKLLAEASRLPETVVARQLERTELTHSSIGQPQAETLIEAGEALKAAGVLPAATDVPATVNALLDRRFAQARSGGDTPETVTATAALAAPARP
jgi:sulfonate transport system substrate-binding protein